MSMPTSTMGRLGPMDIDRWMAEGHFGKRVFLDGVDITNICRWFDDVTGEAECFKQPVEVDAEGHVPIERRSGRIEVNLP